MLSRYVLPVIEYAYLLQGKRTLLRAVVRGTLKTVHEDGGERPRRKPLAFLWSPRINDVPPTSSQPASKQAQMEAYLKQQFPGARVEVRTEEGR